MHQLDWSSKSSRVLHDQNSIVSSSAYPSLDAAKNPFGYSNYPSSRSIFALAMHFRTPDIRERYKATLIHISLVHSLYSNATSPNSTNSPPIPPENQHSSPHSHQRLNDQQSTTKQPPSNHQSFTNHPPINHQSITNFISLTNFTTKYTPCPTHPAKIRKPPQTASAPAQPSTRKPHHHTNTITSPQARKTIGNLM